MSSIFSNFVPITTVQNMAYKKGEDRRQRTLFPDCIDDYVGEDAPVRLMDAFVDRLDMEKRGCSGSSDGCVRRSFGYGEAWIPAFCPC